MVSVNLPPLHLIAIGNFYDWAQSTGVKLSQPAKRYVRAMLIAQNQLPDWIPQLVIATIANQSEDDLLNPLELAVIEIFRKREIKLNDIEIARTSDPHFALITAMHQDKYLADAAEALRDFLNKLEVLLESGCTVQELKSSLEELSQGKK